MNIRFVSSLTPEDEEKIAPVLLKAVGAILDSLPLAYTLRIETAASGVYQHAHTGVASEEGSGRFDNAAARVASSVVAALRERAPLS
jgi:hypothetical protein